MRTTQIGVPNVSLPLPSQLSPTHSCKHLRNLTNAPKWKDPEKLVLLIRESDHLLEDKVHQLKLHEAKRRS